MFKDSYVVDIGELEIRGYYNPTSGSGGQEVCSDNVLTHDDVIVTASDTEVTGDIYYQSSPNALIDGGSDCSLNSKWKSGSVGQTHSVFLNLPKPVLGSSLSLTAPWKEGCYSDNFYYSIGVYGSNTNDGYSWSYINLDSIYVSVYSGNTATVNFNYNYYPYKYYKIDFYGYQVELAEIALKGCYDSTWPLENESSLSAKLTRVFGSARAGIGAVVGVCLFVLIALVAIVVVIRRRRANAKKTTDEEELQVINDNSYQKM